MPWHRAAVRPSPNRLDQRAAGRPTRRPGNPDANDIPVVAFPSQNSAN